MSRYLIDQARMEALATRAAEEESNDASPTVTIATINGNCRYYGYVGLRWEIPHEEGDKTSTNKTITATPHRQRNNLTIGDWEKMEPTTFWESVEEAD
jgi:hypothetical protein